MCAYLFIKIVSLGTVLDLRVDHAMRAQLSIKWIVFEHFMGYLTICDVRTNWENENKVRHKCGESRLRRNEVIYCRIILSFDIFAHKMSFLAAKRNKCNSTPSMRKHKELYCFRDYSRSKRHSLFLSLTVSHWDYTWNIYFKWAHPIWTHSNRRGNKQQLLNHKIGEFKLRVR